MRGWGTYFSLIQTKNSSCVEAFKVGVFAFYVQVATYWYDFQQRQKDVSCGVVGCRIVDITALT